MPRPSRGRRAAAPASAKAPKAPPRSPSVEPANERGRSKMTRQGGRLSVEEENMIRAANRNRDAALERLAIKDATTSSSNNGRGGSPENVAETGRRGLETPAHARDTTGLDLVDDSIFGDLDDSFADGEIPQGLLSTDTSIISLNRFRSRQSSFAGRNDGPIRPSSRGPTTPGFASSFNIGAFRRRPREPSILGTSRKPLREPSKAPSKTASETESESEDDFQPEAESTPLNNRRKTRQSQELRRPSPSATPDDSNLKKRKSEDTHERSIRPDKTPRRDSSDEAIEKSDSELSDAPSPQQPEQDSDSELSDLPSPQEPPGLFRRPVTPVQSNDDEVHAPPASSGSEGGDDVWPDIRTLAKKRRRPSITTPSKLEELSDISSPPSLTHSPNFEDARGRSRARPASRQQASPKLTTADLTNLLPKRRYKKARDPLGLESDEELDATGLGEEEDELSYLDTQAARRKKGSRAPSRSTSARPASRGGRAPPMSTKQKLAEQSSRRSSDKENEGGESSEEEGEEGEGASRFVPLAEDTFDAGTATPSADELKQASRKFKEVDKWELEFEEVTETSSPQDGR